MSTLLLDFSLLYYGHCLILLYVIPVFISIFNLHFSLYKFAFIIYRIVFRDLSLFRPTTRPASSRTLPGSPTVFFPEAGEPALIATQTGNLPDSATLDEISAVIPAERSSSAPDGLVFPISYLRNP